MKKWFLLMIILMLSPYVCYGETSSLEMTAEKYNNLTDKPLILNIKPELCSVSYDLKKNTVEIKPYFLFSSEVEKYEPTLVFDSSRFRLALRREL
jgi:hypothetical protein